MAVGEECQDVRRAVDNWSMSTERPRPDEVSAHPPAAPRNRLGDMAIDHLRKMTCDVALIEELIPIINRFSGSRVFSLARAAGPALPVDPTD